MKFEIKKRFSDDVVFTAELGAEFESAPMSMRLGAAVKLAVSARANLSRADLSGANLSGANLSGADLSGANLSGADLSRAYLSDAYLSDADLSRADLSGADLSRADLSGADLSRAYLSGAQDIIDAGFIPSPCGYRWVAVLRDNAIWIKAGCRWQTIEDREKQVRQLYASDALALRVRLNAIDYIRAQAEALGWDVAGREAA